MLVKALLAKFVLKKSGAAASPKSWRVVALLLGFVVIVSIVHLFSPATSKLMISFAISLLVF